VFELTTIYCPECGGAAEDIAPEDGQDVREAPGYRHVGDRTSLCEVLTRAGWRPAEPVEGGRDGADV
jgi:hypothetical protein